MPWSDGVSFTRVKFMVVMGMPTSLSFSLGGGCQASPTPTIFSFAVVGCGILRKYVCSLCIVAKGRDLRVARFHLVVSQPGFLRQARQKKLQIFPHRALHSPPRRTRPKKLRPVDLPKPTSSRVLDAHSSVRRPGITKKTRTLFCETLQTLSPREPHDSKRRTWC